MPEVITKSITAYTFKELCELKDNDSSFNRAYDKARDWLIEGAVGDAYWHESTISTWKECLEQFGFMKPEIYFRGFWSQGDGACFSCRYVDVDTLIDVLSMNQVDMKPEITFDGKDENFIGWANKKIDGWFPIQSLQRLKSDCISLGCDIRTTNHHYVHSNCRRLELWSTADLDNHKRVEALINRFEEVAERLRMDWCDAIYKDLENEYDYRTKDEQLIEDAAANEWKFDEHGGVV